MLDEEGLKPNDTAETGGRAGNDFDDVGAPASLSIDAISSTSLQGNTSESTAAAAAADANDDAAGGAAAAACERVEERAGPSEDTCEEFLREVGALDNGLGASGARTTMPSTLGADSPLDDGSGASDSRRTMSPALGAEPALDTGVGASRSHTAIL